MSFSPNAAPSLLKRAERVITTTGTLASDRQGGARAQRWQSGSIRASDDHRHVDPTTGAWPSRAAAHHISCGGNQGGSSGQALPEEGQVSWIDPRARCPQDREPPGQLNRGYALGMALGFVLWFFPLMKISILSRSYPHEKSCTITTIFLDIAGYNNENVPEPPKFKIN